jgi:hypothetical protein
MAFRPAPGAFPLGKLGAGCRGRVAALKRGFGPPAEGAKKLRKSAAKSMKSLARVNLCADAGIVIASDFFGRAFACVHVPACWCSGGRWPRWFPRAGDPNTPAVYLTLADRTIPSISLRLLQGQSGDPPASEPPAHPSISPARSTCASVLPPRTAPPRRPRRSCRAHIRLGELRRDQSHLVSEPASTRGPSRVCRALAQSTTGFWPPSMDRVTPVT